MKKKVSIRSKREDWSSQKCKFDRIIEINKIEENRKPKNGLIDQRNKKKKLLILNKII